MKNRRVIYAFGEKRKMDGKLPWKF